MNLPKNPIMLLSAVNMQLRDHYETLEEFVKANDLSQEELCERLKAVGYEYQPEINQFR